MKIETRYNVGDTVWTIIDNKAERYKVHKIICVITRKLTAGGYINENNIVYHLEDSRGYDIEGVFDGEKLRKTKEELLELL